MRAVQRSGRADREADAVQRERIAFADRLEPPVRRPARAHVVLGVDFEEAEVRAGLEDGVEMLGLEADADAAEPRPMWPLSRESLSRNASMPASSRSTGACYRASRCAFAPKEKCLAPVTPVETERKSV